MTLIIVLLAIARIAVVALARVTAAYAVALPVLCAAVVLLGAVDTVALVARGSLAACHAGLPVLQSGRSVFGASAGRVPAWRVRATASRMTASEVARACGQGHDARGTGEAVSASGMGAADSGTERGWTLAYQYA